MGLEWLYPLSDLLIILCLYYIFCVGIISPIFFFFFARNALFKSDSLQKDPRGEAAEFALNKQTKSLNFCLFIFYFRLVSLMAMPVD